jgi:hypothetical protein
MSESLPSRRGGDGCSFPACRCEWSNRHEHCPRYGATKGPDPTPEPPEPWGTKLTIAVYVEGSVTENGTNGYVDAINAAFPDAEFISIHRAVVRAAPEDQIAT